MCSQISQIYTERESVKIRVICERKKSGRFADRKYYVLTDFTDLHKEGKRLVQKESVKIRVICELVLY